ncbi:hypothetical protein PIB30_093931 [Stylosanthes scabra]|uniref:Transposase (Putative), gypsy type n=1 Tax=Stylosanthes scabra TaxID=79078 RepID=A0ABU6WTK3_9FABA|nr:hypothetical protein [Stylosanthes scabra]
MAKKKSCQNVRRPRVLSEVERALYGWVDEDIFSQPSVITANILPKLRHGMGLTEDWAFEGDYVIEAVGHSDRLPIRAEEDRTHFLWVYQELFTRLGVRFPFTEFQREVMMQFRTIEHVCLHFGFRLSSFIFMICTFLPPEKGLYRSVPIRGGGSLMPLRSLSRNLNGTILKFFLFLVDDLFGLTMRGNPFPGCIGILSLLGDMENQTRFVRLRLKMAEVEGTGPRSILPTPTVLAASAGASASSPLTVVPPGPSGAAKSKKVPPTSSAAKPICLDGEEGVKDDPSADLKQKKRKRKLHESFPENAVLGDIAAWEHEVSPLDHTFPVDFNYWAALDSGMTQSSVRKALEPMPPEQLLKTAYRYACKLTACLQVGLESALSSKVKVEKELAVAKDQGERLSALEQLSQVDEDSKVQTVELQSCRAALDQERKKVEALARSLEEKQTTMGTAEAAADHWRREWKALDAEIEEIVQETFSILLWISQLSLQILARILKARGFMILRRMPGRARNLWCRCSRYNLGR